MKQFEIQFTRYLDTKRRNSAAYHLTAYNFEDAYEKARLMCDAMNQSLPDEVRIMSISATYGGKEVGDLHDIWGESNGS